MKDINLFSSTNRYSFTNDNTEVHTNVYIQANFNTSSVTTIRMHTKNMLHTVYTLLSFSYCCMQSHCLKNSLIFLIVVCNYTIHTLMSKESHPEITQVYLYSHFLFPSSCKQQIISMYILWHDKVNPLVNNKTPELVMDKEQNTSTKYELITKLIKIPLKYLNIIS